MDTLIELIFELILEGSFAASKSSKIPKPIRYLIILLSLLYLSIIGFIFYIGVIGLRKHLFAGVILIAFGILLILLCIRQFNKIIKKDSHVKEL